MPTLRTIDVDGAVGRVRGLVDIESWEVYVGATVLETTVENLRNQNSGRENQSDFHSSGQESLYTKYRNFIEDFDKLSPENQKAVIQIVSQITH